MQDKKYCVYMHKNKINGKVYIGVTSLKPEHRWESGGKGYENNIHFTRAIQKYGWDEGFEHVILHDGLSKFEAMQKEIELISFYDSTNNHKGYNISPGGNLRGVKGDKIVSEKLKGHSVAQHTRDKLREASLAWYSKHDNPRKGHVKSDEEKYIDMMAQKTRKPVLQIDLNTGEVIGEFPSLGEAGRKFAKGHYSNIKRACNGELKSASGYGWRFKEI